MKKHSVFYWLLLPPALLACLVSLGLAGFLLSAAPPVVLWISVGVLAVVVAWFVVVRRRGSVLSGSETSLMGRQSSKEGLL